MTQPPSFVDPDQPTSVCKLRKAIYGLKQAPRAWYQELRTYLVQAGFTNSVSDTSLFHLCRPSGMIYLLVYVDDIIITGSNPHEVQTEIDNLTNRFSLKDLGMLHYFLGVEVFPSSSGLFLNQHKYIIDLLERFNMSSAKSESTPLAANCDLSIASEPPLADPLMYRQAVGSMQYLSLTRPDVAYAINKLSQYMHRPSEVHWSAAKRVLRYLAGTSHIGLHLKRESSLNLHAFSDADWAGDKSDYLSTGAYIVYLGGNPISWSSKKHKTVARSSTEAEYRTVANTSAEIRWLSSLLHELGVSLPKTPVIYCDNVGATNLCANPVFHSRMKHVALDYHFIREQVQTGTLRVAHIANDDQLADVLTKPLPRQRFSMLISKIGLSARTPVLRGHVRV